MVQYLTIDIKTHVQRIAINSTVLWTTLRQGATDGELKIE